MLKTEGADDQLVIRRSAMVAARPIGSFAVSSAIRTRAAPCLIGTYRSRMDRSKWNGACEAKRSVSAGWNTSEHQSTKLSALRCESITPFGFPVDPEVYST